MTQQEAVMYALTNLYTPVLNLTISASGGSATGQQYFEQPYLVRAFKTDYFPTAITPTHNLVSVSSQVIKWNQTKASKENYVYSMNTEQNGYTYVGANNPAPVEILNDMDCLWWIVPFSTKLNITVTHVPTLTTAVDTFPVIHKFQWVGYKLTTEIVSSPELLYTIINTLRL